ncbi:hypothetical protein NX059_005292 [Plenodomus lindquistii]|nr:hypothetical protein NX059_005292 [Plenodomus lindquistii]
MTADRRAPAPALSTKGRQPSRASRQNNDLDHSHIRVIPHRSEGDGIEDEYDDGVPTFRSSSLQFASRINSQTRAHDDSTVESLSQVKTFADMARRYHHMDDERGSEESTSSPGPLGGIVTLQPHRKSWQTTHRNGLPRCENTGDDASESSLGYYTSEHSPHEAMYTHAGNTMALKPCLQSQIQSMLDSTTAALRVSTMPFRAIDGEEHQHSLYETPSHSYEKLFGKLPDPIRLHEQTGNFDGQVVFIGHPNRDVSAHQWSSNSYQWVNIGRYAHIRGKVEGSLASDCLGRYDAPQHPLEFFKCAAENRESLAVERARRNTTTKPPVSGFAYSGERAAPLEVDNDPSTPESLQDAIIREDLEDPFVARASSQLSGQVSFDHPKVSKPKLNGSLDFQYEFPFKRSSSPQSERHNTDHRGANLPGRVLRPLLQEVSFGENAATHTEATVKYLLPQQQSSTYPSVHSSVAKRVPGQGLVDPGMPASYARMTTEGRAIKSNVPNTYATARSLFPASGLTVANPRRTTLNAVNPEPSQPESSSAFTESEASGSQATTINPNTVALRFSDPDGMRQSQDYEIANGLSKQAPTVQNMKGPFFTDTKPTTSDPTAQLSVNIGEEQKLSNWFHNGCRSARQQAYATSLMATAVSFKRGRHLGAIGETIDLNPFADYENTPAFVRLYENLSEYVDERRNSSGGSYFTRAWKTGSQDLDSTGYLGKLNPGLMNAEGTGTYQVTRYATRGRGGA